MSIKWLKAELDNERRKRRRAEQMSLEMLEQISMDEEKVDQVSQGKEVNKSLGCLSM